jgi:RsiW-degrading membrane proteinase PrsW (M82 family)
MQAAALAISPAIALLWFLYARAAYRPERKTLVAGLFLAGALCAGLALVLNHLIERDTSLWAGAPELSHRLIYWIGGIGLNEEFAKMLVLLVLLYPRKDFAHPYQGLLGAATVSMGFAAVENLVYLERYGTVTLLVRSMFTIPAHAFFTIPLGVTMGYSKRARRVLAKYGWLAGGLAVSALLHGLYDIWLSFPSNAVNSLSYLQVGLMALLTWRLMRLANAAGPPLDPGSVIPGTGELVR